MHGTLPPPYSLAFGGANWLGIDMRVVDARHGATGRIQSECIVLMR
jgi:hypothetical protein